METLFLVLALIGLSSLVALVIYLQYRKVEADRQLIDTLLSHIAPNKRGRIAGIDLKNLQIEWEDDGVLAESGEPDPSPPPDPRAPQAVRLIRGCLEVDPHGTQIIPANKIRGMSPETRKQAVDYLIERNFVMKTQQGAIEITKANQSFARILAQLPQVGPDVLESAVNALPRVQKSDGQGDDDRPTLP